MIDLGDAAIWYAKADLPVFPLPPRGKTPAKNGVIASVDDQGGAQLDQLRANAADRLAEIRDRIEAILDEVHLDADMFDLPDVPELPVPQLDGDRPVPLLDSGWATVSTFSGEPQITRRTFLATLAGSVAAAGCGMCGGFAVPSGTAASDPDLAAAAAHHRDQTPTQWGTSLTGVAATFAASGRQIALTFDACPGACDDALLATLERSAVPALLFLNSRWIDAHPGRAEQLAANPLFEIGNHGTRHVPLSVTGRSAYGIRGTRSADEVVTEVWTNHTRLAALTGKPPTWFRPGTAYYDDVAVAIVAELGERPLGFSVDADNGAKASAARVRSQITGAAPGSIVLAHMNHPESGTAAGVSDAITDRRAAGWEFVSLAGQIVQ